MKVLIACEESQRVCQAFRDKGHEAYSDDILDCSGGRPEWHIKGDVLKVLNPDIHCAPDSSNVWTTIDFDTMDGVHQLETAGLMKKNMVIRRANGKS